MRNALCYRARFVTRSVIPLMSNRHGVLIALLFLTLVSVGCVRTVKVARTLPVEGPLDVTALVARVNSMASVERVQASISLQFRDLRDAEIGRNKEYPAASGTLVLSRPGHVRLRIKAPFIGKTIADMVSDGTTFRVKVYYPEDKQKFIVGSNEGRYKRVDASMQSKDAQLQSAGALANIRPQHLTEAFLVERFPLDNPNQLYVLDEVKQTERDTKSGSKAGADVIRSYYVLTLLEQTAGSHEAKVLRRVWFDRCTSGTPLARQELYEDGRLSTSIRYQAYGAVAGGRLWPERVSIERVQDLYSVDVIFEPKALTIDGDVPAEAFELDNEEHFPEIDLDKRADVIRANGGADAPKPQ